MKSCIFKKFVFVIVNHYYQPERIWITMKTPLSISARGEGASRQAGNPL